MIKEISLKNFQSHKDSRLELSPGVNAITGKSDSGKSAVIRAINYLRWNRPASNNFPSHWIKNKKGTFTGEMSITLKTQNEIISRYRNKDANGYTLSGETLEAVSRDVPEMVEAALNLSEVNVQRQLDAHFLLADTPGQVAQFFNDLMRMDDIDYYLSAADSMKRKTNAELKALEADESRLSAVVTSYGWLAEAKKQNEELGAAEEMRKGIENEIYSMISNLELDADLQQSLNALSSLPTAEKILRDIGALPAASEFEFQISALQEQLSRFSRNAASLDSMPDFPRIEKTMEALEAISTEALESEIREIEISAQRNKGIENLLGNLQNVEGAETVMNRLHKYSSAVRELEQETEPLSEAVDAYDRIDASLVKTNSQISILTDQLPDVCPLCGQQMEDK